jgi:hypothetical protein
VIWGEFSNGGRIARLERWDCELALKYVALSRSVQLRAMVEDWPFHRIKEAVLAQTGETGRP